VAYVIHKDLGFVTKTYITKESYVIIHYAMNSSATKAYVT
jgi:hypothetical protein